MPNYRYLHDERILVEVSVFLYRPNSIVISGYTSILIHTDEIQYILKINPDEHHRSFNGHKTVTQLVLKDGREFFSAWDFEFMRQWCKLPIECAIRCKVKPKALHPPLSKVRRRCVREPGGEQKLLWR